MEIKQDGKVCFFYPEYGVECGDMWENRRDTIAYKYVPYNEDIKEDGFKVAIAYHNKKDGPFVKEIGRKVTLGRLDKEPDDEVCFFIPMSYIKARLRKYVFSSGSWLYDKQKILDAGISIFSRTALNRVIFEYVVLDNDYEDDEEVMVYPNKH